MKKTSIIMTVLAVSAVTAFARPHGVEMDFAELLPEKWTVVHFESDASAPYSWEHDQTNVGISIRFEGPTKVDFRGTLRAEAVVVWIMPKEYVGNRLQGAQFAAAVFLGQIGNHKLYAHSLPEAKTWPSWRQDLKKKLKSSKSNQAIGSDKK